MGPQFEVMRDSDNSGWYRLRLTGPDGEVLADLRGLPTLDAVKGTITEIREVAALALVVDRTAQTV